MGRDRKQMPICPMRLVERPTWNVERDRNEINSTVLYYICRAGVFQNAIVHVHVHAIVITCCVSLKSAIEREKKKKLNKENIMERSGCIKKNYDAFCVLPQRNITKCHDPKSKTDKNYYDDMKTHV